MAQLLLTLLPVAIAVIGLLGVLAAAIIAARTAIRSRLYEANDRRATEFAQFQVRATAAINELLIVSSVILDDFEARKAAAIEEAIREGENEYSLEAVSPEVRERAATATAQWRAVLAESHVHPDEQVQTALVRFDEARSAFVDAINARDMALARTKLNGHDVQAVYRTLLRTRLQHDMVLLNTLTTRALRGGMKKALAKLREEDAGIAAKLK
jgi:hypothetical protein